MAILMGRFARAGAVAFVVTWAVATLTMTAASLDAGSRPSVRAGTPDVGQADAVSDADADISSTPTIRPPTTTVARAPAVGAATSTTRPSPAHLSGSSSAAVVATEVLPSTATAAPPSLAAAAQPVTAQPDFTG